jgi:hypothetical protein
VNLSRLILYGIKKIDRTLISGRYALQKLDRPVPQPYNFRWLRYQYETELSWIRQIRQELQEMEATRQWAKL